MLDSVIKGLYPKDELNLLLVIHKLKKSSYIELDPLYFDDFDIVANRWHVKLEDVKKMESFFEEFNLFNKKNFEYFHNNNGVLRELLHYTVSNDYMSYYNLVRSNDNKVKGLSLGYPEKCVDMFNKEINGKVRNGSYLFNAYREAVINNVQVPTWLAYISFIPSELDIVNGVYCKESKELGEKYESFINENYPVLKNRLLDKFNILLNDVSENEINY